MSENASESTESTQGLTEQTTDNTEATESTESLAIQGIEPVSEADLMGYPEKEEEEEETEETEGQEGDESSQESSTASSESKEEETEEAAKEETEAKEQEEETESKPPKGFVPVAAVHEARGEIRYLKEQIATLTEKVSRGVTQEPEPVKAVTPPEFTDFKELSSKDLEELVLEDPAEAILYTHKLQAYKTYEQTQAAVADAEARAVAESTTVINAAYNRMDEAVPGLFDDNSDAGAELAEFAKEVGFGADVFFLTNPGTKVIPPGQTEAVVLGDGAASIIELLANVRSTINEYKAAPKEDDIREQLTKEITEKVQKELLEKFKSESKSGFKGLGSAEGTEHSDNSLAGKMLTESEFSKLSDKQQEAYLAGG